MAEHLAANVSSWGGKVASRRPFVEVWNSRSLGTALPSVQHELRSENGRSELSRPVYMVTPAKSLVVLFQSRWGAVNHT